MRQWRFQGAGLGNAPMQFSLIMLSLNFLSTSFILLFLSFYSSTIQYYTAGKARSLDISSSQVTADWDQVSCSNDSSCRKVFF